MIVRNIVNYAGAIIGVIEFDDDTTEEQIAEVLAQYAEPPPPPLIADVTAAQLEAALLTFGKTRGQIEAAMDKNSVSRYDGFIEDAMAMLDLTPEQMDAAFILAATL